MADGRTFVLGQFGGELIVFLDDGRPIGLLRALKLADCDEMIPGFLASHLGLAFVEMIIHHPDGEEQPK